MAKLRESKTVSQEQYDKAVAELKVAEADKAMIEANIAKKTLRAPFDAIAGLHQFERGQYLEENTLITTLVGRQDFVWVDFSLSQVYGALPSAASVTIEPLFIAQAGRVNNSSWAPIQAPVIAREAVMKQQSRSLSYRAQVDKGAADLLANAIVNVKVPIAKAQPKLTIPALSVLHSTAGAYVYVLDADNEHSAYRARRQAVTLGEQLGDQIIVESGLAEGDHIASVGAFKLSPGLLTYLQPPVAHADSISETDSLEGKASQDDL
jgi:membrane fusion protein (multidrug efflux system)